MSKSKTGFITTPSGVERSILTVHGALLCEDTIILLGDKSQTVDFKKYDTEAGALSVFQKLKPDLKKEGVIKGDHFIELPNGNLLRKEQITAIELITNGYQGFILRNRHDEIIDFVHMPDVDKHEVFKTELLDALTEKVTAKQVKFTQPDWEALGLR